MRYSDAISAFTRRQASAEAGQRLMLTMARPRRPRKGEDPHGVYWFDDQDRRERLYKYCKQDVEVERELFGRLRPLPPDEQRLRQLDLRINARGIGVDRKHAKAARKIAAAARPKIDAELAELTEGVVTSVGQVARLLPWLQCRGYEHMRKLYSAGTILRCVHCGCVAPYPSATALSNA